MKFTKFSTKRNNTLKGDVVNTDVRLNGYSVNTHSKTAHFHTDDDSKGQYYTVIVSFEEIETLYEAMRLEQSKITRV